MTNDLIAKELIVAAFSFCNFFQVHRLTSCHKKETFLLAALIKQKHKTLIAQQKLNIQKKKNAKVSDKLKQAERKVMDSENVKNDDKTLTF